MNHHHYRIFAVCAALAGSALGGAPAWAQGARPPQAAVDAAALQKQREIFTEANKLWDDGKYPQAEQLYLQAWKIKKTFDVAANLGTLEADMNKPRAAAEFLAYALREYPAGGKAQFRDALVKRLVDAQKRIGTLRVRVNKPGAEVMLNGQSTGVTPLPGDLFVEPGTHQMEVKLEGYLPQQVTVTVAKGKTAEVTFTLAPPAGANKKVIVAGAVAGGVAVIAGAVMMGLYAAKGSSASSLAKEVKAPGCPSDPSDATGTCGDLVSALNAQATFGTAGVTLLAAGGAVGLGTLIYGLAAGSRAPRTGMHVLPVLMANGGGLSVGGTF